MEKKILLAVDGSDKSLKAASILGRLLKVQPDLRLVLVNCVQQLATILPGELCMDVGETCRLPFSDQEKLGSAVITESRRVLDDTGFPKERIESEVALDSTDPALDIISVAKTKDIPTIALGRRGRGQLESLLIGSTSSKLAHYAKEQTVWIVDTPVHETRRVLVAVEGAMDAAALTGYAADFLSAVPDLHFTFLHIVPPMPPTLWDDGHILTPEEQKQRQGMIDRWRAGWIERIERLLGEAKAALTQKGVAPQNVETLVLPAREGIARDLLNEIAAHEFQVVVMGKRSLQEEKPFLMGSHANKVLQNVKSTILCLVNT